MFPWGLGAGRSQLQHSSSAGAVRRLQCHWVRLQLARTPSTQQLPKQNCQQTWMGGWVLGALGCSMAPALGPCAVHSTGGSFGPACMPWHVWSLRPASLGEIKAIQVTTEPQVDQRV